ncbi:unnamed protein product [Cuscuta europaea]|uniref:Histone-lysine N-methyltransferase ASHH2 n=1 Tax=Cuscuta europaea TaxID=41803 RepID=A0A9P0ZK84_CUSEU|nr:unnamed protein product [Cuscuta europaea]
MSPYGAGQKLSVSPKSTDEPFKETDDNLCSSVNFLDVCMFPRKGKGSKDSKSQSRAQISGRDVSVSAVNNASVLLKSVSITRKRINNRRKPAPPSAWRLLGSSLNGSEPSDGVEIVAHEPSEARRDNVDKKSEKVEINQTAQHEHKPVRKNRISLKVKFGNRCLMDVLPLIQNGNEIHSSIVKEPLSVCDDIDTEFSRSVGIDGFNGCPGKSMTLPDISISNLCLDGNPVAEKMAEKSLEEHLKQPAQTDLEKLGTAVDNRCSGPGTSPDSEVINVSSGAPISQKVIKDSPSMLSNQAYFSSRDGLSVGGQKKSLKKRKKKDRLKEKGRLDKVSDFCTNGTIPSLEFVNNDKSVPNGSNCGNSSALTTTENISGDVLVNELHSKGSLPSPVLDVHGISNAISEYELREDNFCYSLNTELPESQMTLMAESSLSSLGKLKLPESRRYQEDEKICNSSPKREHASKRKGNKGKKSGKCDEEMTRDDIGLVEVKDNPTTSITENETKKLNQSDIVMNHVPRNAWVQCDDCHKWRRISAFLADKIEETNCRWICKDNLDKNFSDCSTPQEKSNAEINVELELSDMSGEEDVFDTHLNRDTSATKCTVSQSSTWTLIKWNIFLNRSRKSQTIDEVMICHCKPPSDGRIGCGNGCLNRMLNIECVPGSCPSGEQCSNQQFQRRNYANLKWYKCGKKGYGLQILEDVSEGCFIIEYVGEVLDVHAYEARQKDYALKGHKHFYFMTLNGSEVIDACAKGNLGRFINHSCDPNCRTEKWMVNGEVCIGLFAVRDIKKGEELTFDYNYVRVFGAAAKKCVCGTPQCRGYIGGDPQNAEVIIQDDSDDEFPEPVVICEEDDMYNELSNIKSASSTLIVSEERTSEEPQEIKETLFTNECLKDTEENETSLNISSAAETSVILNGSCALSCSSIQPAETSSASEDITSETNSEAILKCSGDEKDLKSLCSPAELEIVSSGTHTKQLKKSKSGTVRRKVPLEKRPRSSPCVKKSTSNVVNIKAQSEMEMPNMTLDKPKKVAEGSLNGRFEAVEAKLNELLDLNGGISKSKDAPRYYLKLLLLTAASGDIGNGEAIQSNRELSMILGALLKTKSRTVLVDIINKNGLQMLHNIMKRYRREFNKTPILRKLLKVLEYLALREILTIEHINWVPSRPGVESFRESILALTEHIDKQVHQIARNFRDRWIPKPPHRKNSRMDNRIESCNARDASEPSGAACSTPHSAPNGMKTRKRKSRWDQGPDKDDCTWTTENDFPPGFSPHIEHCTAKQPVMGQCQERFASRLLVSYGIPLNLVHKIGVPLNGSLEGWAVAPGVPFHPFPPLPAYSRP